MAEETQAHKNIVKHLEGTLFYDHVKTAFYRQNKFHIEQAKDEEDVIDAIDTEINLTGDAPRYLEKTRMRYDDMSAYRKKLIGAKAHLLQKISESKR